MAISNSTFVRQLYQTLLARDPDSDGTAYWATPLDSGFSTRAQVAYSFLSSSEYDQGVETIARLYYASFKRVPDIAGLQFWMSIFRQGASLDQIAGQFVNSSEFRSVNGGATTNSALIDILYANVLGRAADAAGKASWVNLLDSGKSAGAVLNGFAHSGEFKIKANPVVSNALTYYAVLGRAATASELASTPGDLASIVLGVLAKDSGGVASANGVTYSGTTFVEAAANDGSISNTLTITLGGDTFSGKIGSVLGKVSGLPTGLTASITKTTDTTATMTLSGAAKSHGAANSTSGLAVAFSASDFSSASIAGKIGLTQYLNVSFVEVPAVESGGVLTLSGTTAVAVKVDLAADKLYFGSATGTLLSGSMSNVKTVDASALTGSKITLTIVGDSADNVFIASPLGGTMSGGGGNDTYCGGSGVDKISFGITATENGLDTIKDFTLGSGGDILDFSAFLNKTGTAHITPVASTSIGNAVWSNGDVLVATGYSLDTTSKIAALFNSGAAAPFAAPTAAAKAVIITADIVGDASVWYVVNQTGLTVIDSSEVSLVGTLKGINNLGLSGYGFTASNFA